MNISIIDNFIKYKTDDNLAYADIEKTNNWHICYIESKRKGGGSELLNKIITDAKNLGIKKITLTTTKHIGWSFFNKFNFIEIGDDNNPYDMPMALFL